MRNTTGRGFDSRQLHVEDNDHPKENDVSASQFHNRVNDLIDAGYEWHEAIQIVAQSMSSKEK